MKRIQRSTLLIISFFICILLVFIVMAGLLKYADFSNRKASAAKQAEYPFEVVEKHSFTNIIVFKPTGVLYVSTNGAVELIVNADGTPYTLDQWEHDVGPADH